MPDSLVTRENAHTSISYHCIEHAFVQLRADTLRPGFALYASASAVVCSFLATSQRLVSQPLNLCSQKGYDEFAVVWDSESGK
jgi:hypothetical protein